MKLEDFLEFGVASNRIEPNDTLRLELLQRDIEECGKEGAADAEYETLLNVVCGRRSGRVGNLVSHEQRSQMLPLCIAWNNWGYERDLYIEFLKGSISYEVAVANNPRFPKFHQQMQNVANSTDPFALSRVLMRVMESVNQYLARLDKGKRRESRAWSDDEPIYTLW